MTSSGDTSRSEASALAGQIQNALLDARRLAASAPGRHGRRTAGVGEAFWQFRDHRPEDGARLIDWRRTARGERPYVRELEREAAQTAWFWVDPGAGFDWTGDAARPTKRRRAMVICLAAAIALARSGERVGALGAGLPARQGPQAGERLAFDLAAARLDGPPPRGAALVLASDFYLPVETWAARIERAVSAGAGGALLIVADPAEEDFPFEGRTAFQDPAGVMPEIVLGRAQSAREDYAVRYRTHRAELAEAALAFGVTPIRCRTDQPAALALQALLLAIGERR